MSEVSKSTTERDEIRKKKSVKHKKGFPMFGLLLAGLMLVILFLIAADVYLWKAQYFLEHFYQNTIINGKDCSDLNVKEVKALIQDSVDDYEIVITTLEGERYTITGPELELMYVDDNAVDILMKSQKPLLWIQKNEESASYEIIPKTWYNEKQMEEIVQNFPFMDQKQMIKPQDAYVSETDDEYIIVPEVEGNTLDVDKLFELVMVLFGFYILFAIQNVFDATFYGLGKTHYMLFESIVTNSIYYGITFILYVTGVWRPTLIGIALLFGIGNAFDTIVSLIAYWFLLKRHNINILDVEDNTKIAG